MFFDDEDKEQSKNMDDYDLDFPDDNSIRWDRLLDEAEAEQAPRKPTEDDLLTEDEDSFDHLLANQELNIDPEETIEFAEDTSLDFTQDINIVENVDEVVYEPQADIEIVPEVEDGVNEISVDDMLTDLSEPEPALGEISYSDNAEEVAAQEPQEVPSVVNENVIDIDSDENDVVEPQEAAPVAPTFEPTQDDVAQEEKVQEEKPSRTPIKAPSKGKDTSAIWGAVVGVALVVAIIAGASWYMSQEGGFDSAQNDDFDALLQNGQNQSEPSSEPNIAPPEPNMGAVPAPPMDPTMAPPMPPTATTPSVPSASSTPQVAKDKAPAKKVADTKAKATDKKAKSSQKVTLKVVNSGRLNPFSPVGNFNKFGFMTSPKVDILEPPTQLGDLSGDLDRLTKITVSGILYDTTKPSAIINVDGIDYFVQKYDRVDDFTVAAISKDMVVIKKGNNTYRATIGQTFNNGMIAGQIQNRPTRQYVSAGDVNVNPQP